MNKKEIENRVKSIFISEFKVPPETLKPEAHIFRDLGLDSIDAIDMAVRLEMETGLKLKALELKSIRTLQDIVDVIHKKTLEKNKEK